MVDNRGGTKRLYKGTNLYNIYDARSYTVELTMMGNMQIQPLQYFNLDNVPFFNGAYMITKVSHAVVANNVVTHITGMRLPKYSYPIVESSTTYLNISLNETLLKDTDRFFKYAPLEDDDVLFGDSESETLPVVTTNGQYTQNVSNDASNIPNTAGVDRAKATNSTILLVNQYSRTYNIFVEPQLTLNQFYQNLERFLVTNPKGYGLKVGNCYAFVKLALQDIGIYQDPFYANAAWRFFAGLPPAGMKWFPADGKLNNYSNEDFRNVINPVSGDKLAYVFGYYRGSTYRKEALRVFLNEVPSELIRPKLIELEKYAKRGDTAIAGFQYAPVTHIGLWYKGMPIHNIGRTQQSMAGSFVPIAWYPIEDLIVQKINQLQGGNPNVSNRFIDTIKGFFD